MKFIIKQRYFLINYDCKLFIQALITSVCHQYSYSVFAPHYSNRERLLTRRKRLVTVIFSKIILLSKGAEGSKIPVKRRSRQDRRILPAE